MRQGYFWVNEDCKPIRASTLAEGVVLTNVLSICQLKVKQAILVTLMEVVEVFPLRVVLNHLLNHMALDHHEASSHVLNAKHPVGVKLKGVVLVDVDIQEELAILCSAGIHTSSNVLAGAQRKQPQDGLSVHHNVGINEQHVCAVRLKEVCHQDVPSLGDQRASRQMRQLNLNAKL